MKNEQTIKIFKAAAEGNIKSIGKAIKNGASIKAREKGHSPLSTAAREGHLDVVKYLISLNAPVTDKALAAASVSPKNRMEILKLLQITQMRQVKPDTKFNTTVDTNVLVGAYKGDMKRLKLGLSKYGDPDSIDGLDTSALRWAARFGRVEIVEELIHAGAKVNLASKAGWTAIMEAIVAGSREIVELLIKKGADVNSVTFVNASPLYFAMEKGDDEIIDLLKKQKAKLNSPVDIK